MKHCMGTVQDNDFELINRFLAGEEVAFNLIVKKYQKKIYWHARQMLGNHLEADEVTQEVLIVLFNKLRSFNFNSSLYTWIYKIVSTRSLNQIRKRQIQKFFSIDSADNDFELKDNTDIIEDYSNKEKLERVEKILQKIPPKQREIFIMRNYDQLTYEEISKITGKSIGGLKANYFHALKKVLELSNEK
ncbi:MAG: RNA polymerase sigma factor [Ignavibacteriales bacterium]|nr:RNA polymerase sigma factor [Ignavibacteriales bacterium]